MKGIFRRLGSPASSKGKEAQQQSPEAGSVTEQLARAESLMVEIRTERSANFPLLNNATRLGVHLCSSSSASCGLLTAVHPLAHNHALLCSNAGVASCLQIGH